MAYININEVDKTSITAPIAVERNTVFVPINSSDGPSDKPVLCTSYDQFIQTFGTDPNTGSSQMTSWEYAANLLLHRLPVMVRRITHYLDNDGNNTVKTANIRESGPLAGVGLASGVVTGPNIEEIDGSFDPNAFLYLTKEVRFNATPSSLWDDNIRIYISSGTETDGCYVNVGSYESTEMLFGNKEKLYNCTPQYTPNASQYISITNIDNSEGSIWKINLSDLILSNGDGVNFTAELKNIYNNKGVDIKNEEGVVVTDKATGAKTVVLAPNQTLRLELTDANECVLTSFTGFNISGIRAEGSNSHAVEIVYSITTDPEYSVSLYIQEPLEYEAGVVGLLITATPIKEDVAENTSNLTLTTNNNTRVNLMTAEYRHAGVNGNKISVSLHTVDYDAIYLEVYNGSQRLEQIKLVNLRYRNEEGFWSSYNFADDAETIWALLLQNFGIKWSEAKETLAELQSRDPNIVLKLGDVNATGSKYLKLSPLVTNYMQISLNPAIPVNGDTYRGIVASVASCTREERTLLSGGSNPSDDCVINEVPKVFKRLQDKYLYNIKFIANGGYVDELITPSSILKKPSNVKRLVESSMLQCAQSRGDCLAFIDIPLGIGRDDALEYFSYIATSYGTAYAPWVKKQLDTGETKWCPPSFIALETIAKSIEAGNEIYAPPAGVNRGIVSSVVDLSFEIPADYIDYWSDNYTQFINPIVYIDGYGYSVFGQKTLYNVSSEGDNSMGSALQYLNTRLVANEIKKKIFECCVELTFEQNNLHTWIRFSTMMSELLNKLKSNNAISYYECLMDESTMTDYDIRSNHIVGTIRVAIGTTAEKFDIAFEMIPNSVKYINIDYNESNQTY